MTATDELRALLDARGVEWDYGISGPDSTMFRANGVDLTFTSMRNRLVCSTILTPVQAVEATLGRGECKLPETRIDHGSIEYNGTTEWRRCSECGEEVLAYPARFCPNCGREVVG